MNALSQRKYQYRILMCNMMYRWEGYSLLKASSYKWKWDKFLWPSENIPNLNSLVLLTLVIGQIDISHLFRVFFFVSYWYNSWNYVLSYFRFLLRSFWMTPHVDKGRWKVHLYPRSFSQFVHLWERWKGQKRLEYLMQLFFIKNRKYIYKIYAYESSVMYQSLGSI